MYISFLSIRHCKNTNKFKRYEFELEIFVRAQLNNTVFKSPFQSEALCKYCFLFHYYDATIDPGWLPAGF